MRFDLHAGTSIETVTPAELREELIAQQNARQWAWAEGKKEGRIELQGQAVAGKLQMGGDFVTGPSAAGGASVGGQAGTPSPQPRAGYVWMFRRMAVSGLTFGTTPDVVNLFRSQRSAVAFSAQAATLSGGDWQFNGNTFGYTFGANEMTFWEGETPILLSQGTFVSTAVITLKGDYIEVPKVKMFTFTAP